MRPDVARLWTQALRSGRYRQCRGQLRSGDTFCAQGVLVDILNPGGWKRDGLTGRWAQEGQTTALPMAMALAAGCQPGAAVNDLRFYHVEFDGEYICDLNDRQGKSFADIADFIEAHAETL